MRYPGFSNKTLWFSVLCALALFIGCEDATDPDSLAPQTTVANATAVVSDTLHNVLVVWSGSDSDGQVVSFKWRLRGVSIPEQGYWSEIWYRTENHGTVLEMPVPEDITYFVPRLQVVAIDDDGWEDPTPAEASLMESSTAPVGTPRLSFRLGNADGSTWTAIDSPCTVGTGIPFRVAWSGESALVDEIDSDILAHFDEFGPVDGLLGFKYRLPYEDCNPYLDDCWRPRRYDEASGDSVSYWSDASEIYVANEAGDPGEEPLFPVDGHFLKVNAIDVLGNEVLEEEQSPSLQVGFSPEARILLAEYNPCDPTDPEIYPYYRLDDRPGHFAFDVGDTVPDGAYVVSMAVGRDDYRDITSGNQNWEVQFLGHLEYTGFYRGIGNIRFSTGVSERTCGWPTLIESAYSADTLGFYAGPFSHALSMYSIDESDIRSPADDFVVQGNFPPCVQCIELVALDENTNFDPAGDCWNTECIDGEETIWASSTGLGPDPGYHMASPVEETNAFHVNTVTGEVFRSQPTDMTNIQTISASTFVFRFALHGQDGHEHERPVPGNEIDRIKGWMYQVDYDSDPNNSIRDGGGIDDIRFVTETYSLDPAGLVHVDDDGTWFLTVEWMVPTVLLSAGRSGYMLYIGAIFPSVDTNDLFAETTKQLGSGAIAVKAVDQASCGARADIARYHYYHHIRPTRASRDCFGNAHDDETGTKNLADFAGISEQYSKSFRLRLIHDDGSVYPPLD